MKTPTPRTDAATYPADCLGKTLVTHRDCARALETELGAVTAAYTCTHHNDQQRAACPVCLVAALTAERDHWQEIAKAASAEREHNANVAQAMTAERDQLRAQLHALQLVCGTNDANKFETWIDRANARAERAEAELAAERKKVRVLRSALENLCDEQNGAPLETRRDQWQLAMAEAGLALATTEDAK